jgi:hypothetical protein
VEKIYKCIIIALLFLVLVFGGSTVFYARKSNESGRLCNQLRERIIDAENTNRGLAETIERSQSICGELEQSVDRNITTARAAVEVIEEVRVQVQSLEMELGGFDSSSYYNHWDSVFGLQQ